MSRCGIDTGEYFEHEDFMPVFDFNTPDTVTALGTGVSEISERVLREIEVTIKNHERQKASERSHSNGEPDIQPERGLSDTRPDIDGTAGGGNRQIRSDAPALSEESASNLIQFPSAEREIIPPPVGDRADSGQAAGGIDAGAAASEPAPEPNRQSDGLGTAHEPSEATSRGNDTGGADLHLTAVPPMDDAALNELLSHSELEAPPY